jgi:hypothetical protein
MICAKSLRKIHDISEFRRKGMSKPWKFALHAIVELEHMLQNVCADVQTLGLNKLVWLTDSWSKVLQVGWSQWLNTTKFFRGSLERVCPTFDLYVPIFWFVRPRWARVTTEARRPPVDSPAGPLHACIAACTREQPVQHSTHQSFRFQPTLTEARENAVTCGTPSARSVPHPVYWGAVVAAARSRWL